MKLFVYGTLKAGNGNNYLLNNALFDGEAVIEGYKLTYAGGKGSFPFAIPSEGEKIRGEVYEVREGDTQTVPRVDMLEGHPTWYRRTQVKTEEGDDVELYVMNSSRDHLELCPKNSNNEYVWQR